MQRMLLRVAMKELDIQGVASIAEEQMELDLLEATVQRELGSVESVEALYSRH